MAITMQEVFGDMLLSQRVDKNETCLPSPWALRRRILLKHKKLPNGEDENVFIPQNDDSKQEMDLRNTVKNGILFLEDPVDKDWHPHFFVLTEQKLYYTDTFSKTPEASLDDEEEVVVHRPPEVSDNRFKSIGRIISNNCVLFLRVFRTTNYTSERNGFTENWDGVEKRRTNL